MILAKREARRLQLRVGKKKARCAGYTLVRTSGSCRRGVVSSLCVAVRSQTASFISAWYLFSWWRMLPSSNDVLGQEFPEFEGLIGTREPPRSVDAPHLIHPRELASTFR